MDFSLQSIKDSVASFFDGPTADALSGPSNVEAGGATRANVLPTTNPSLAQNLLGGVLSYFRSTPTGQQIVNTATQQTINDKIVSVARSPITWIIAAGVVALVLFRKR